MTVLMSMNAILVMAFDSLNRRFVTQSSFYHQISIINNFKKLCQLIKVVIIATLLVYDQRTIRTQTRATQQIFIAYQ